jgi:hypothetical protein
MLESLTVMAISLKREFLAFSNVPEIDLFSPGRSLKRVRTGRAPITLALRERTSCVLLKTSCVDGMFLKSEPDVERLPAIWERSELTYSPWREVREELE